MNEILRAIFFSGSRDRFITEVVTGDQFPSACGIMVFHDFRDLDAHQLEALEDEMRSKHYGLLLASTACQARIDALLENARWEVLRRFKNPNSGNGVTLWVKDLTQPSRNVTDSNVTAHYNLFRSSTQTQ